MFSDMVSKGNNGAFHYLFTVILTIFGYVLGSSLLYLAVFISMANNGDIDNEVVEQFAANPDFSLLHLDSNVGLVLILATFVVAMLALYIGVRFVHKRPFITVISPDYKFDWKRLFWSFSVWILLLMVTELIFFYFNKGNYHFRGINSSFIVLVLISIFILPIQTAFEEIFVRGYILQSVSYNTKNIFAGFAVSVFIFAMLHAMNPETTKYGFLPMMSYYVSAAVLLGLIVIFDQRLELAIGVHTATNFFGAVFLTYESAAIQTQSLFIVSKINPIVLAVQILILGALFLYMARRKYKWGKVGFSVNG